MCIRDSSKRDGAEAFSKLSTVSERFLSVELEHCASLPFDEYLRRAVRRQAPVMRAYPRSPVSRAFEQLAEQVAAWPAIASLSGQLEFFVEQLITADGKDFLPGKMGLPSKMAS